MSCHCHRQRRMRGQRAKKEKTCFPRSWFGKPRTLRGFSAATVYCGRGLENLRIEEGCAAKSPQLSGRILRGRITCLVVILCIPLSTLLGAGNAYAGAPLTGRLAAGQRLARAPRPLPRRRLAKPPHKPWAPHPIPPQAPTRRAAGAAVTPRQSADAHAPPAPAAAGQRSPKPPRRAPRPRSHPRQRCRAERWARPRPCEQRRHAGPRPHRFNLSGGSLVRPAAPSIRGPRVARRAATRWRL